MVDMNKSFTFENVKIGDYIKITTLNSAHGWKGKRYEANQSIFTVVKDKIDLLKCIVYDLPNEKNSYFLFNLNKNGVIKADTFFGEESFLFEVISFEDMPLKFQLKKKPIKTIFKIFFKLTKQ